MLTNKHLREILPEDLWRPAVVQVLKFSLAEDICPSAKLSKPFLDFSSGDITSMATLKKSTTLQGVIRTKAPGVVAGLGVAAAIFVLVEPKLAFIPQRCDGDWVAAGDLLAEVRGSGAALLTAERTALNFLGRMSGIATLTRRYCDAIAGTKAAILDTRKTVPGLRMFDKYAVRMGGGANHRMGLYDMALIKDNHIDGAGGITAAVERLREKFDAQYPIEIEVKNLAELKEALALNPDRIMLDNMSTETMQQAVQIAAGCVPLEASGNVSLETVRAIAETGVDYISVGALTHSVPVLDISMRLK